MKVLFLVLLFGSINVLAANCKCPMSTSPGSGYTWVEPGEHTWDHSYGNGGTCTATCHVYPSGNCGWKDKSSGCGSAITEGEITNGLCRLETIKNRDGEEVDCIVCQGTGVTCNWKESIQKR